MRKTRKVLDIKQYRYEFPIILSGVGRNADEAWNDAVEAFSQDPGYYEKAEKGDIV